MRIALFCLPILFPVAAGAWLLLGDRHPTAAHGAAESGDAGHGHEKEKSHDHKPPPAGGHDEAIPGESVESAPGQGDSHAEDGASHKDAEKKGLSADHAESPVSPPKSAHGDEHPQPDASKSEHSAPDHTAPVADHAQSAAPHAPSHGKEITEAEDVWTTLLEGNQRFLEGKPARRDLVSLRKELAKGQHPKVIVLGCADSRVSPSLVFDQTLGELFEVRVAGNIADPAALGSIEYAVEHLHSEVLLVLGHEKCGAVAAAAAGGQLPTANLEAIVRKITPAIDDLQSKATGDALLRQCEEANVRRSARDLIRSSPIIRKHLEEGKLTIFLAVYKLATGEVKRIE